MEEVVYNAVSSYFKALGKIGYINDEEVNKIIFLVLIQEFAYNDFRGMISKEDYKVIDRALYTVFGRSCLVPYPDFCSNSDMDKLHLGDLSELAKRVASAEASIAEIQGTSVVKKLSTSSTTTTSSTSNES